MTSIRPDGRVEFRFFRPNALSVKVLGDFNGWAGDSLLMSSSGDGWWTAICEIEAGEYRFRYFAEEAASHAVLKQWYTDFAAYGVESAKHGWNSVLFVPDRSDAISAAKLNKGSFATTSKTSAKLAA